MESSPPVKALADGSPTWSIAVRMRKTAVSKAGIGNWTRMGRIKPFSSEAYELIAVQVPLLCSYLYGSHASHWKRYIPEQLDSPPIAVSNWIQCRVRVLSLALTRSFHS